MLKPLTKEAFGAGLSALRRKAKMKQADLGAKIGVAGPTISRWEDGHVLPSQDHVEAVCALFGVSEEYFTGIAPTQVTRAAPPLVADPAPIRELLAVLATLDDDQVRDAIAAIDRIRAESSGALPDDPSDKTNVRAHAPGKLKKG